MVGVALIQPSLTQQIASDAVLDTAGLRPGCRPWQLMTLVILEWLTTGSHPATLHVPHGEFKVRRSPVLAPDVRDARGGVLGPTARGRSRQIV